MGHHALLQGIFLTPESNPHLLRLPHWQVGSLPLAPLGKPSVGSVQLFSCVLLFATPWTATCQPSLSITNSRSLLKTHIYRVSDAIQPSHSLSSPSSVCPSIRVFSNESALRIRWPKYWSFSFIISPSNVYSGLISFRIDWFDLFAVQGTLKSLLQHTVQKHFFSTQLSLWSNSHGVNRVK